MLFEGCFLCWSEQIFLLHLKTDDLLHFLLLSQALDINQEEMGKKKRKSYFTRHFVITLPRIAVSPLSGAQLLAGLPYPRVTHVS